MSSVPSSHNSPTPPIDRSKGTSRGGGGGGLITAILAVLCVILAIVSLYVYQGKQQSKEELAKMTEAKVKVEEDLKSKSSQVEAIQRELQTRYVPISTLPSQLQGSSPGEVRGKIAAMVQQLADMTPATPTSAPTGGPGAPGTPGAGTAVRPGDAVSVALENVTKAVVNRSIDTKAAIGTDAAKIAIHRDIQTVLARLGSYSKPISGNQKDTMDAVLSFQKSNGLKPDGVIGKGTWGKVREKLEGAPRAGAN